MRDLTPVQLALLEELLDRYLIWLVEHHPEALNPLPAEPVHQPAGEIREEAPAANCLAST